MLRRSFFGAVAAGIAGLFIPRELFSHSILDELSETSLQRQNEWRQILMQLHDKQVISTETLLAEFRQIPYNFSEFSGHKCQRCGCPTLRRTTPSNHFKISCPKCDYGIDMASMQE